VSQQVPDRIETQVNVESIVKPTGITFELRVSGSAAVGSMAAVRKSKELVAIQECMARLGVPDERIRIESVSFEAGERWLSGSTAEIDLEIRDVPLSVAAEALGNLSAMKGVSLKDMRREYGLLREERDELLRRGVEESMRQARLIADAAGLPILSIYSMTQKWLDPDTEAMTHRYQATRGMRMSKSAASIEPDEVKGYQLLEHHESKLILHLRMDVRVGEFLRKA